MFSKLYFRYIFAVLLTIKITEIMKAIKKITIVVLMLGTLIGYAKENKNSTDNDNEGKKTVKVEFKNVKKGQTLTIKNDQGLTVYNYGIKNSGNYSKTFNFSALEDGIYSTELNKDFEIIIKKFQVKNGLVTFLNDDNEKIFKPIIRKEGNLILLSKITFNQKSLDVAIYYNGINILSETVKGEELTNRIYKLSENKKGDYKVVVDADNRSYTKHFSI
jgi:hypothetical protein